MTEPTFEEKFPELKLKVRNFKEMPPCFSERNGYTKLINISFVQEHCLSRSRVLEAMIRVKNNEDSIHADSFFEELLEELELSEELK